jgi:hypothetical protein
VHNQMSICSDSSKALDSGPAIIGHVEAMKDSQSETLAELLLANLVMTFLIRFT